MNPTDNRSILVWDTPVRVFHWLLVLCFFGAFASAESERWRLLHITLGYTVGGLIVFRVLWGLIGTRHARFGDFVRGPRAAFAYLKSLLRGKPEHHVGHNPAGGLAIVALLGLALVTTLTGWAAEADVGARWLERAHEPAANLMMALVALHIAAVLLSSWLHRENLVGSMVTGRKLGSPQDGIRRAWRAVAALMLAATLGFWWVQWQTRPVAQGIAEVQTVRHDGDKSGRN